MEGYPDIFFRSYLFYPGCTVIPTGGSIEDVFSLIKSQKDQRFNASGQFISDPFILILVKKVGGRIIDLIIMIAETYVKYQYILLN